MQDLQNPKWMFLKAGLFLVIGMISVASILAEQPTLRAGLCLALAIWAFCRAYYFAFYVIERYIDPRFKFSGLFAAVKFLLNAR
jgi:hypothetical protein